MPDNPKVLYLRIIYSHTTSAAEAADSIIASRSERLIEEEWGGGVDLCVVVELEKKKN